MNPIKKIFLTIHYLRFKFQLSKKMDQSRRYFALLLSLQGDKKRIENSTVVTDQDLYRSILSLKRQRHSIELGSRIEQISSMNN